MDNKQLWNEIKSLNFCIREMQKTILFLSGKVHDLENQISDLRSYIKIEDK